jgi:uncharacterized protein YegP (UPF0339 family)
MRGRATVEIYRDRAGAWRWRVRRNGRITAICGEGDGYTRRRDARRAYQHAAGSLRSARVVNL